MRAVTPTILISLAIVVIPSISYATVDQFPCTKSKTTMALNACVAKQYQSVKQKLATTYQTALNKAKAIDAIQRKTGFQTAKQTLNETTLAQSQVAWQKYQTLYCNSVRYYFGYGTYRTVAYWSCMQTTTENRIAELNNEYIRPAITQPVK